MCVRPPLAATARELKRRWTSRAASFVASSFAGLVWCQQVRRLARSWPTARRPAQQRDPCCLFCAAAGALWRCIGTFWVRPSHLVHLPSCLVLHLLLQLHFRPQHTASVYRPRIPATTAPWRVCWCQQLTKIPVPSRQHVLALTLAIARQLENPALASQPQSGDERDAVISSQLKHELEAL